VFAPASTAEVVTAVLAARRDGRTVRMVGSGHSFTGVAVAPGLQLLPHRLSAVRSVDRRTGVATVEAGITLASLCEELAARGLALTNLGDIRGQTLAGALQTGTHGTGRAGASLAAQVLALELVLADGSVTTVSADEDGDLFHAARVGLGAFGIITAVTLRAVPAFLLRAHEEPRRLDEVLGSIERWYHEHDHVEFYWFPHTRQALLKRNDRTDGPARPLTALHSWADDELLANTTFGVLNRIARKVPRITPGLNAVTSRVMLPRTYVDDSWRVLTSTRRVRFVEQEYAVPLEHVVPAVRELVDLVDRSSWRLAFPVEVRMTPADSAWLSPAYGRDTAYLAVHCYERTPYLEYFAAVEAMLVELGGRPHWGKLHSRGAADLAAAYPRWDDAQSVRDRVDPERRFANRYVAQVLGD
jgi:FAD-linked oxidoreductase